MKLAKLSIWKRMVAMTANYFIHAKKLRIHKTLAFTENEQVKKMNKNT